MDPHANIVEAVTLAGELLYNGEDMISDTHAHVAAQRLAELVVALHEWRTNGGYDPYPKAPVVSDAPATWQIVRADGNPDIRHAGTWLRAGAKQLHDLKREHGDERLGDLAYTLSDIAARAAITDRYAPPLPTVAQANAIVGMGHGTVKHVLVRPFDLPADYLMLVFESGFTCGIAPDGSVSS